EFIEQAVQTILRRADLGTRISGKDVLPMAGEYTAAVLIEGLAAFARTALPDLALAPGAQRLKATIAHRAKMAELLGGPIPLRPPSFCTGCPERPVFTALKLLQRESGRVHIAGDIGCHALATFAPFSVGNSILGYGMSLASAAGVGPMAERRTISIM